jgi:hypothetical protein
MTSENRSLQWMFDPGESDPEWVELSDEERAELRAEGLPEDYWTAQWSDFVFIVTEQQDRGYVLRTADWSPDVAYPNPGPGNRLPYLPRLGTDVDFPTLAEAQQHAQKMCDEMGALRNR